ncbi:Pumilio-family RNA binding repeat containing protein [Tritrichomonas foetus]|uniref:Pumilio-family RNA binding repeat containing protein n=1 Tax=Tritrichomonas foetus TaxID=1144522 RepID=A0A1J4K8D7_9EUKA|nr:Pumilio-family RNA binding repeat containing protein [Tritrichomonas foetus]|eukprot:OHT07144.1 Pumilio-family RNA binding repeat containing protein [Tritrichomonas foetus]
MSNQKERHLSMNEVKYFERAMDTFSEIKNTPGVNDFFKSIDDELRGKEILIAEHKFCSRFLDEYIQNCPVASLEKLFRSFSSHFDELSRDRFASHGVENLLKQAVELVNTAETSFNELLASFVTEITPVAGTLAEDPSGSHVIRCVFSKLSILQNLTTRIDKLARKIIQTFIANPSKIRTPHFSATVQAISSLDSERFGKLLKYLLSSVPCKFDDCCDRSSSKLIESLIINMGTPAITAVYNETLKTGVADCAFHSIANYVVQKWLLHCKDNEQLIIVCDQLIPKVENLLARKPQVVVALSSGLINTNHKLQRKFYDILGKQCYNDENIIDHYFTFSPPNGSKILQSLCYFEKNVNSQLIDSMMKLGGERVAEIAADLGGSYFVSDYLKSEIDIKMRLKIVRRLLPKMGHLASNNNGRFVVEAAYNISDLQLKSQICKSIVDGATRDTAKTIWRNFRIEQFISRPEQWEKDTENIMKRSDAMDSIINDETIPDVKPLAPAVIEPTPEMEAAAEELEGVVGSLHRRKRRHHRHEGEE